MSMHIQESVMIFILYGVMFMLLVEQVCETASGKISSNNNLLGKHDESDTYFYRLSGCMTKYFQK